MKSETMSQKQCRYRKLPLLSEVVSYPVFLLAAALHVISAPLGIEPVLAALTYGCYFGLIFVPPAIVVCLLYFLEHGGILPQGAITLFFLWIAIPFCVLYTIQVLILDKLPYQTKNATLIPHRNAIEQASGTFFASAMDYFPVTVIPWSEKASLPPNRQYIFGVHPHGVHCPPLVLFTTPGAAFDVRFPGLVGGSLTGLAARIMFQLPVIREFFIHMGYIDASRVTASKAMEAGRSIFICVGGEEESMLTEKGKDIVVLSKRKGFVRLALSYGAALVPVFGAGTTDMYQVRLFVACGLCRQ